MKYRVLVETHIEKGEIVSSYLPQVKGWFFWRAIEEYCGPNYFEASYFKTEQEAFECIAKHQYGSKTKIISVTEG